MSKKREWSSDMVEIEENTIKAIANKEYEIFISKIKEVGFNLKDWAEFIILKDGVANLKERINESCRAYTNLKNAVYEIATIKIDLYLPILDGIKIENRVYWLIKSLLIENPETNPDLTKEFKKIKVLNN